MFRKNLIFYHFCYKYLSYYYKYFIANITNVDATLHYSCVLKTCIENALSSFKEISMGT